MPIKGFVRVNEALCKGCGLCVSSCPTGGLELDLNRLNAKGYHPAFLKEDICTGCCTCAVVCPEAAIVVLRQGRRATRVADKTEEAA